MEFPRCPVLKIRIWDFFLFCLRIFEDSEPCRILVATPDTPFLSWVSRILCLNISRALLRLSWNLLPTCLPSFSQWAPQSNTLSSAEPEALNLEHCLVHSDWLYTRKAMYWRKYKQHVIFTWLGTPSFWKNVQVSSDNTQISFG